VKEETVRPIEYLKPVSNAPEGLEGLFERHHDMIFRTAYRTTASVVDAEDVLQTVFVRLAGRKGKWDLSPNPGAYLYRAAINASLDLLRGRGRFLSVPLDTEVASPAGGPGTNPETEHAKRELQSRIRQSVSELGPRAAEIVVLKYFEGHDNREIAKLIGTSQMVVGVTLHRARTRLRKDMGKFLEEQL
jgi:RNA polymerase sigma-70 factor (ECF subfamily)